MEWAGPTSLSGNGAECFTDEQEKKNTLENGNSLEEKKQCRASKGEHYTFVELPVLRSVWNVGLTRAGG